MFGRAAFATAAWPSALRCPMPEGIAFIALGYVELWCISFSRVVLAIDNDSKVDAFISLFGAMCEYDN